MKPKHGFIFLKIYVMLQRNRMKWILYFLASIPGIYFFASWQFAEWAYVYFECKGGLKDLEPCFIGTYNIVPHLGFGFFLAKILWIPAVILSITLMVRVHKHYKKHNKYEETQ